MKFKSWAPKFIILLSLIINLFCQECIYTENCSCSSFLLDYRITSYRCPIKENPDVLLSVITKDKSWVYVTCQNSNILDVDILPELHISTLDEFYLANCYANTSFVDILSKLGVEVVHTVNIRSSSENIKSSIFNDKESFKYFSLYSLKALNIEYGKVSLKDYLKNTPYLVQLHLLDYGLTGIDKYLKYVPNLKWLNLSYNQIKYFPKDTFKQLELIGLFLNKNQLKKINKETFRNLKSLKELELSQNQISNIDEDAFFDLVNINRISLHYNNISKISSKTFRENSLLESIDLSYNYGIVLQDHIFENLTNLEAVNLSNNKLKLIPENTFSNCRNLVYLSLANNNLFIFPNKLFYGLENLKLLNLSNNDITLLKQDMFLFLYNLEKLDLSSNKLRIIKEKVFENLINLDFLDLSKNQIKTFEVTAFGLFADCLPNRCTSLTVLNLEGNKLNSIPDLTIYPHLKEINLSFNSITIVKVQDLISDPVSNIYVDLKYNNISYVDFTNINQLAEKLDYDLIPGKILLNLKNNPIACDCFNFELKKFKNSNSNFKTKEIFDFELDEDFCADIDMNCPLQTECPCHECSYRSYDKTVMLNCSFQNLFQYPYISRNITRGGQGQPVEKIVLNLTKNHLREGPFEELENYETITYLDLSKNSISRISWIPPNLKELNLTGNNLTYLDNKTIAMMKNSMSLEKIILKNNSWVCSCSALELQNYLKDTNQVSSSDVYCEDKKIALIEVRDLCSTSYLIILLPVILSILLLLATCFALYLCYQTEIKVYLYSKNICLRYFTEEDLDKDRKYDVFISYAHQDEKFVVEQLLPVLEHEKYPMKVCIHTRDWIPGEFIAKQIVDSVKDSRRTMVVLSNDFLDSIWGKLEFRTAHTEAMSEGRARVIVLIYGELNEDKLDSELRSYLKTNTYVKWGEKYFWSKLRYALPHSRNKFYYKENLNRDSEFSYNLRNLTKHEK